MGGDYFVLALSFCLSVLFKQYLDDKGSLYCGKVFSKFFFPSKYWYGPSEQMHTATVLGNSPVSGKFNIIGKNCLYL